MPSVHVVATFLYSISCLESYSSKPNLHSYIEISIPIHPNASIENRIIYIYIYIQTEAKLAILESLCNL
jgi:hypothetical protein